MHDANPLLSGPENSASRCLGCGRFVRADQIHCPDCDELPESGNG